MYASACTVTGLSLATPRRSHAPAGMDREVGLLFAQLEFVRRDTREAPSGLSTEVLDASPPGAARTPGSGATRVALPFGQFDDGRTVRARAGPTMVDAVQPPGSVAALPVVSRESRAGRRVRSAHANLGLLASVIVR